MSGEKDKRAVKNAKRDKTAEKAKKAAEKARARAARDSERQRVKAAKAAAAAAEKRLRDKERAAKAALARERAKKRRAVYAKIRAKLKNRKSGFDYDNAGILPRVELAVDGDRTSVLSRLGASGITVRDVRFSGGKTCVKIRKKDLRKAVAILNEMCYTSKVSATFGMPKRLMFLAARSGLIIGACVSVVGLYLAYGYVWRLDISGNGVLSDAAIESALSGASISVGCRKSDALSARAAEALCALPGVADCSCEVVGTTLHVNVLESEDSASFAKYGEYVSRYDATVTRIVMRSGTVKVQRGDVVKRGDVLADGDVFSTNGELLYTSDCDGEVYGKISLVYSAQIPIAAVEYRRTGRSSTQTTYTLFGKEIGKARSPYATCESASGTSRYDLLIPLYVTTHYFYETVAVEYERDIKAAAESFAKAKIEELAFEGEFDSKYTAEASLPGLYTVHLFLTGETVISEGRARTTENARPE